MPCCRNGNNGSNPVENVKKIRLARWIVIRQHMSPSACLTTVNITTIGMPLTGGYKSDRDGRRNHHNLTLDDDTLFFSGPYISALCLLLFSPFLFSLSKKIVIGWNWQSIRPPETVVSSHSVKYRPIIDCAFCGPQLRTCRNFQNPWCVQKKLLRSVNKYS